jgi:hypothetical protein
MTSLVLRMCVSFSTVCTVIIEKVYCSGWTGGTERIFTKSHHRLVWLCKVSALVLKVNPPYY